jgi:hypothetical protein
MCPNHINNAIKLYKHTEKREHTKPGEICVRSTTHWCGTTTSLLVLIFVTVTQDSQHSEAKLVKGTQFSPN